MTTRPDENGPPLGLAVANVHPDYIDACMEGCCTGSRFPCSLPVGTVTLVRQTSGGSSKKQYGVVGVWYYSGESHQVSGHRLRWSRKFPWLVQFKPLVPRLERTFCEEFTVPVSQDETRKTHRASLYVSGLHYTKLQGIIVRVPLEFAAPYLHALLNERPEIKTIHADYRGQRVIVGTFLTSLAARLDEDARRKRAAAGRGVP